MKCKKADKPKYIELEPKSKKASSLTLLNIFWFLILSFLNIDVFWFRQKPDHQNHAHYKLKGQVSKI